MGTTTLNSVPFNLPVAPDRFAAEVAVEVDTQTPQDEEDLTELENHAHAAHVLLSSDAMRYLARQAKPALRLELLDKVIAAAKIAFPSDDGWVVVNLSRMEHLVTEVSTPETNSESIASVLAASPQESMKAGSLAEAIVLGNVAAAYELIENRPMIALADAAADFDAVYRARLGEQVVISDLLRTQTIKLHVEQIRAAILALAGALDGTYTDEVSAVKMAILKAVKLLNQTKD